MKLKTYHSASVEAAVRLAGVELGDDAIFLGSRENPRGQGGGGQGSDGYEVTFAVMETPAISAETESQAGGDAPSSAAAIPARQTSARQTPAPRTVGSAPARSAATAAAAAAGATQTRLSSSAGTDKRIERPHWKRYIPEDLETNLQRAPVQGGNSTGRNNQTRDPAASGRLAAENSARGKAARNVPAAAARNSAALAAANAVEATTSASTPAATDSLTVTSILGLSAPPAAPTAPAATATAVKLAPAPESSGSAAPASEAGSDAGSTAPTLAAARLRSPSLARLHEELLELRRLLEKRPPLGPSSSLAGGLRLRDSFLATQYARLAQNGLDPLLIFRLISPLLPLAGSDQEDDRESRLQAGLESLCNTSAELGDQDAPAKICAFVGPSGAGKTSAAVKLALHHGWQRGVRVHLISLDQHRLGAAQQLQAYARVAEIPITTVEDVSELGAALDRLQAAEGAHRSELMRPELVFIDTPSYAPSEWERAAEAAQALSSRPGIERHLVLSLTASQMDQHRALDSYRAFGPAKLLFTKLDECSAPGSILNESVYAQLPVSFISTGPAVPEDIRPASPGYLAELMLKT